MKKSKKQTILIIVLVIIVITLGIILFIKKGIPLNSNSSVVTESYSYLGNNDLQKCGGLVTYSKDEVTNNMIAKYQYILRSEVETSNSNAEKYAVESLKISSSNVDSSEDISIYGVQENSKYINLNLSNKDVCISDGFADKYSLKVGDSVTLKERYGTKKYKLKVTKIYHYPSSIAAFINIDYFNDIFDNKDNYFNGYFSNKKITDINKNMILTTITKSELTKVSRQLENSMVHLKKN